MNAAPMVSFSFGWSIPLLLIVAGIVLWFIARRGKRVNDHPACRKCGFDLFRRYPHIEACPECGAGLGRPRAVVQGIRRRQRGLAWVGIVMVVGGLALGGMRGAGMVDAQTINRYKPVWLLKWEMASGSAAAFDEVQRRIGQGALSQSQVDGLVSKALALQADHTKPWDPHWGDLVEAAQDAGMLSTTDWETYARQGLSGGAGMYIRERIRRGGSLVVSAFVDNLRVGSTDRFWVEITHNHFRMGQWTIQCGATSSGMPTRSQQHRGGTFATTPSDPAWQCISPGEYLLEFQGELRLYEGHYVRGANAVVTVPCQVDQTVEILDGPSVTIVTPEEHRMAVERSISVARMERSPPNSLDQVMIQLDPRPVGVAFEVWLIDGDNRHKLGTCSGKPSFQTNWQIGNQIPLTSSNTVDLELIPSIDVAEHTLDIYEIWGEKIILKDVEIKDVP